jgi:transcriptional regulator with XRE-family HTH domain
VNYKHNEAYCLAFGQRLRQLREEKGVSMRELAKEADMEYSQYSKIERGKINTTISTVQAIAEALEVPTVELYDFPFPVKPKK